MMTVAAMVSHKTFNQRPNPPAASDHTSGFCWLADCSADNDGDDDDHLNDAADDEHHHDHNHHNHMISHDKFSYLSSS